MSEDTLLKTLAARARDQQSDDWVDDALWDRYAAGELSEEELQDLVSRTPSADADKLKAAFAPMDQAFKDQIVSSVSERLAEGGTENDHPATEATDKVVSLASRRRKLFAPLAMAATLLLAIGTWQFGLSSPDSPPLPGYTLAVLGGSEFRSTDIATTIPEFTAGDRLEIRLTPSTAAEGVVQGRIYAQSGQALLPVEPMEVELAPTGAARISGRLSDAGPLVSGANTLVIIIGQVDRLPDSDRLFTLFERSGPLERVLVGEGWQAWRIPLVFVVP